MQSDRETFLEANEKEPDNYDHRYVYADWLDEQGEHEEADRQRRYQESEKWLRAFARKHFGWEGEEEELDMSDPEDYMYHSYQQLLFFLKRHVDGEHYLYFDTPYECDDYSEEMWGHFEVVTGMESPTNEYRTTLLPFRCAC